MQAELAQYSNARGYELQMQLKDKGLPITPGEQPVKMAQRLAEVAADAHMSVLSAEWQASRERAARDARLTEVHRIKRLRTRVLERMSEEEAAATAKQLAETKEMAVQLKRVNALLREQRRQQQQLGRAVTRRQGGEPSPQQKVTNYI